jgi:putative NADH-flavin reductase
MLLVDSSVTGNIEKVAIYHPVNMAPHITVVPASTRVGTETIRRLLASSEKPLVRGIYRNTSKAPAEYTNTPNFEAVKGDVESGDGLDFTGSDAVLYVPPPTYEKKMDLADWARQTATNVKNALHRANVKRLVILSGLGSQHDHGVVSSKI